MCKLLEGLSQKVVTDPDVFGGIDAARNVSATGAPAIHEERGSGSSGVTFLELFRGWVKVPRRFPTNAPEAGGITWRSCQVRSTLYHSATTTNMHSLSE